MTAPAPPLPTPPADASEIAVDLTGTQYGLGLSILLLVGLAIRCWHADFGLPSQYHPDEGGKATVVTRLLRGEPPDYLKHPGMMVNTVAVVCAVRRGLGLSVDATSIILTGRLLMAFIGALTVLPTAFLARMLFNRRTALFAGAALAFSPIHTVHSRYLKEDIYLTFWMLVALIGLVGWLKATEPKTARRWLVAGLAGAGLSMGSKYVGVFVVMFIVMTWKCREKASWRATWWLWGVALLAFLAVTPQFVFFSRALRDLMDELHHGVRGEGSPKLFFVQWPDLGLYFLFHGLGWGLSWPLALLALVGIWLGWRGRRRNPAAGWVALAACLWYGLAELTPLKRVGDAERYILPCVPLWAILAAGLACQWRPDRLLGLHLPTGAWRFAPTLLLLPLTHSLALGRGIADDTRTQAARWLRQHGPVTPYSIATLGDPCYQIDVRLLDGVRLTDVGYSLEKEDDRLALAQARVFSTSELEIGRYTHFPSRSERKLESLEGLRAHFPHAINFHKPWYQKAGFNNPDLELRFRDPIGKIESP